MEIATGLSPEALEHEAVGVILEMLPSAVLVADADGKPLLHNRAARQIFGAPGAVQGEPSEWAVHGWYLPDKVTLLSTDELPLARILRGEEVCDELLFVRNGQRPSGVWIHATGKAVRDFSGRIAGGVMVCRDVTEGRLSQQTSVLFSQVVEQIADAVLLTDRQGFIEYVNPAFETMTGFSPDDMRGRTPRILKSGLNNSAFYQGLWGELLAGHPFQATIANRKKTGEIYHVEETITPIIDETGNISHFVAVIHDITEALNRQEREVQLRLAREIQKKFYRAAPTVPGFDVAAAAYPAYETSGDYFDFIPLPHNTELLPRIEIRPDNSGTLRIGIKDIRAGLVREDADSFTLSEFRGSLKGTFVGPSGSDRAPCGTTPTDLLLIRGMPRDRQNCDESSPSSPETLDTSRARCRRR